MTADDHRRPGETGRRTYVPARVLVTWVVVLCGASVALAIAVGRTAQFLASVVLSLAASVACRAAILPGGPADAGARDDKARRWAVAVMVVAVTAVVPTLTLGPEPAWLAIAAAGVLVAIEFLARAGVISRDVRES